MDNYNKLFMIIRKTDLLYEDEKHELKLYLMNLQNQVQKQKEVIDNIKKYLELNIELIKEQPSNDELTDNFILTRFKSLLKMLEEVSK